MFIVVACSGSSFGEGDVGIVRFKFSCVLYEFWTLRVDDEQLVTSLREEF